MDAYITAISSFLPGEPVANGEIDHYLGEVDRISARTRRIILANNGITSRHYAIDPATGQPTHTNAQLAASAVRRLPGWSRTAPLQFACLCCGTSSPDQLLPGHASMVHGELGTGPCEVVSTAGVCLSGMTALKYGAMAVASGMAAQAVATGSELASSYMRTDFFTKVNDQAGKSEGLREQEHPAFSFEANFLRWMLSDGAGALLIEQRPAGPTSLKIEWIELSSQAHRLAACMYAGCVKEPDGSLTGWRELVRRGSPLGQGMFAIRQDARLLNQEVLPTLVGSSLPPIVAKYGLRPEDIDWFLPHYSSGYFREPLGRQLQAIDFAIPQERWFTNLAAKGNTGSASFHIMLEELVASGRLRSGHRLLGMIPESGRFSVGYVLLRVV